MILYSSWVAYTGVAVFLINFCSSVYAVALVSFLPSRSPVGVREPSVSVRMLPLCPLPSLHMLLMDHVMYYPIASKSVRLIICDASFAGMAAPERGVVYPVPSPTRLTQSARGRCRMNLLLSFDLRSSLSFTSASYMVF